MKLSEAIKKGSEMLKEAGIPRGIGRLAQFDSEGNLVCACALGMALIAEKGLENFAKRDATYEKLNEKFPSTTEESTCLVPKYNTLGERKTSRQVIMVEDFVYELNDDNEALEPEKIADALAECGY